MVNSDLISQLFEIDVAEFRVDGIGVATTGDSGTILTFLSDSKYAQDINNNSNVRAVFVEEKNEASIIRHDIVKIIVDEPKWYFFTLLNYLANQRKREKTRISSKAKIHNSAVIAEEGVVISDNVVIEPNVTIYSDVIIEEGAIIRAGAVLGVDGFEHKRTSKGIVSVVHDGNVIVKKNAEIGVNSNIVKGFSYRDTVVGEDTKIDALVHYAHGVQTGSGCMVVACSMIAGHVTIGNDVWIGPNCSIANRLTIGNEAFITFGSVVVKDVSAGAKVTGNFAIPHDRFIQNLKNSVK